MRVNKPLNNNPRRLLKLMNQSDRPFHGDFTFWREAVMKNPPSSLRKNALKQVCSWHVWRRFAENIRKYSSSKSRNFSTLLLFLCICSYYYFPFRSIGSRLWRFYNVWKIPVYGDEHLYTSLTGTFNSYFKEYHRFWDVFCYLRIHDY